MNKKDWRSPAVKTTCFTDITIQGQDTGNFFFSRVCVQTDVGVAGVKKQSSKMDGNGGAAETHGRAEAASVSVSVSSPKSNVDVLVLECLELVALVQDLLVESRLTPYQIC